MSPLVIFKVRAPDLDDLKQGGATNLAVVRIFWSQIGSALKPQTNEETNKSTKPRLCHVAAGFTAFSLCGAKRRLVFQGVSYASPLHVVWHKSIAGYSAISYILQRPSVPFQYVPS